MTGPEPPRWPTFLQEELFEGDPDRIRKLQEMGTSGRFAAGIALTEKAFRIFREQLRQAMPGASEQEINIKQVELLYGEELARGVRERLQRDASGPGGQGIG